MRHKIYSLFFQFWYCISWCRSHWAREVFRSFIGLLFSKNNRGGALSYWGNLLQMPPGNFGLEITPVCCCCPAPGVPAGCCAPALRLPSPPAPLLLLFCPGARVKVAAPEVPGADEELLLAWFMLSRFFSSWASQCLVDLSSLRQGAKVSSFNWSGKHWQSASQALKIIEGC